ncbi:hypothetical protein GEMRC1_011977 [Eukaryota sp. GEM-RC1]
MSFLHYHTTPLTYDQLSEVSCSSVLSEYFDAVHQAQSSFVLESQSAVLLQSHVRRFLLRRNFLRLQRKTLLIQSIIRSFLARRFYHRLRNQSQQEKHHLHLTRNAILIQSAFRGYLSRITQGDYYKSKNFLNQVLQQNQLIRQEFELIDQENRRADQEDAERQHLQIFQEVASSHHHLLSTQANPGVLNPRHYSYPEVFDQPIEKAIDEYSRTTLNSHKKSRRINKTKIRMVVSEQCQGPFKPKHVVDFNRSKKVEPCVRMSNKYDDEKKQRNLDELINKKVIESIHGKLFTSVSKPKPLSFEPSLNASVPYDLDLKEKKRIGGLTVGRRLETFDQYAEQKLIETIPRY